MYIQPKDGYNLVLTVDEWIQSFLENALQDAYRADQREKRAGDRDGSAHRGDTGDGQHTGL